MTERVHDPDDRALWSRAASGDESAFGTLFDRHAKAVYNHCFRLTASWAAAEEHLQNTFLMAWRKRDSVVLENASARPWLLTVATNEVRSWRRTLARRVRLFEKLQPEPAVPDHADHVADRVDDQRRMADLLAAVNKLPRNEREALALCVWSGVTYAEAATVLGIAEGSVRARVSKAKSRLTRLVATTQPLTFAEDR